MFNKKKTHPITIAERLYLICGYTGKENDGTVGMV